MRNCRKSSWATCRLPPGQASETTTGTPETTVKGLSRSRDALITICRLRVSASLPSLRSPRSKNLPPFRTKGSGVDEVLLQTSKAAKFSAINYPSYLGSAARRLGPARGGLLFRQQRQATNLAHQKEFCLYTQDQKGHKQQAGAPSGTVIAGTDNGNN